MKNRLFRVDEHETATFTAYVRDETGTVIPSADLTTLTLTLYQKKTPTSKINSRNAQDILNDNNVTVHATSGLVTWLMQPEDNIVSDQSLDKESHIALFQWSWNSGAKQASEQIEIQVRRVTNVTAL